MDVFRGRVFVFLSRIFVFLIGFLCTNRFILRCNCKISVFAAITALASVSTSIDNLD